MRSRCGLSPYYSNFSRERNFHHLRHLRQFFFVSLVPAPTPSLSVIPTTAHHTVTSLVLPPKKSPGTSKSKAAPTPKTQARTTRSKQTVNEEIEVQQGEKEQPINLEDEPNIHHITDQIKELREHGLELQTSVNDIHNHLVTAGNNHESLNSKLEDIVTYLQANPRHIDNSNTL